MANDGLLPAGSVSTSGSDYMDDVKAEVESGLKRAAFELTNVGGTANAVTCDKPVQMGAALVQGMCGFITWAEANTGAVTLTIGALSAVDVVTSSGAALAGGELAVGRTDIWFFDGSDIRVFLAGGGGATVDYQKYTSDDTWAKPSGASADALVIMKGIGPGGGGGTYTTGSGGGGGGAAKVAQYVLDDLPASLDIAVPAGGAISTAGGTTSVSASGTYYLVAYGGGAGADGEGGGGGGGGGALAVGGDASSGTGGSGGTFGGGAGATVSGETSPGAAASDAEGGGGGGGSGGETMGGGVGGAAVNGGGGGGGRGNSSSASGGVSQHAGDGGAGGAAGQAPGGGGGAGAAGGRGEVQIWVIG